MNARPARGHPLCVRIRLHAPWLRTASAAGVFQKQLNAFLQSAHYYVPGRLLQYCFLICRTDGFASVSRLNQGKFILIFLPSDLKLPFSP